MSEIDRIYDERERERKRAEAESLRRQRHDRAAAFLTEFYDFDVRPSRALESNGIEAQLTDNRLLLHRLAAGIHAEPFQITVGTDGEIDVGGRSLGGYTPEQAQKLKAELTMEILTFFDL